MEHGKLDRRAFLTAMGSAFALPAMAWQASPRTAAYGSGSFGEWIADEHGLPAFRYTCDQTHDPRAVTQLEPGILMPTEHVHQVGNDRLVALASNYGHVQVRQDEGSPKLLNAFSPQRNQYSGYGWLIGDQYLGTFYPGNAASFERVFGVGYYRKTVTGPSFSIDQVIAAPFGDDPVLLSQVTIANTGASQANAHWIEYWGCCVYQFSYRSFLEGLFVQSGAPALRYAFGDRFAHQFELLPGGAGLLETKQFLGRTAPEEAAWQQALKYLAANPGAYFAPVQDGVPGSSFEDLNPPATFLASLDAPADAVATNGQVIFANSFLPLNNDIRTTGSESCLALQRNLTLAAGEQRTLYFLYGYLPDGADANELIGRYGSRAATVWQDSCAQWSSSGPKFDAPAEPWAARETTWNYYYLRSALTYDAFFGEHILSQGGVYQYVTGFQGAARDPLQHALPLVYSDPQIMKEALRYTLKEVRADGSIPYSIVGHGTVMPTATDNSSDLPLWLLWTASEYVLATRDQGFLDEQIPGLMQSNPGAATVRGLLARCYQHEINDVGTGAHSLMRMLNDDWNDGLVGTYVSQGLLEECVALGESVLNSAMASWVFDYYARLLAFVGDPAAAEVGPKAEEHRLAARAQWTGQWLRRAWLGPTLGWLGESTLWLEHHPWAILGGVTTRQQTRQLIQTIDRLLRQPSPLGAMMTNLGPDIEGLSIEPGTAFTGGISPSLNAMLVWALAGVDGQMAWDEWKKNSLARHAEVYPDIWYETWSGPDTINSVLSSHPGETVNAGYLHYADFPVMNLHSHSSPLHALIRLLGVEFTADGVRLAPVIPLDSYSFESPLLGLIRSPAGYEGWYSPSVPGPWVIDLHLPVRGLARVGRAEMNGRPLAMARLPNAIRLTGRGGPGKSLRWSVHLD